MDFTRLKGQIDPLERMGRAEPLIESFQDKNRHSSPSRARFIAILLLYLVHVGFSVEGIRGDFKRPSYFTFGLKSSCERSLFMFSFVMRFTPVSTVSGTFSPLDAAS